MEKSIRELFTEFAQQKVSERIPELFARGFDSDLNESFMLDHVASMCDEIIIDASVPIIVECGYPETEVLTIDGYVELGNRPYNYAVAVEKDTNRRVNIITYNSAYGSLIHWVNGLAYALADIVSFQIEELNKHEDIDKDPEIANTYGFLRSASAVGLAFKALGNMESDIYASTIAEDFREITNIPFEEFIEMEEINAQVKLVTLAELMAINYMNNLKISDIWKSNHMTYRTVLRLEEELYKGFIKFGLFNESTEDKEKKITSEKLLDLLMEYMNVEESTDCEDEWRKNRLDELGTEMARIVAEQEEKDKDKEKFPKITCEDLRGLNEVVHDLMSIL